MIHIEGMGWLGAITALHLEREGVEFSWSDNDSEYVAWKASTGLVSPDGDARTMADLRRWSDWISEGVIPSQFTEQVSYCYSHKNPPHGGIYRFKKINAHTTVALERAYAINVPALVPWVRKRFADSRLPATPDGPEVLVLRAHGGKRIEAYVWGWSSTASLSFPSEFAILPARPVLYGRIVRFITYAYPMPGTDRYRIGSSMVRQSNPKRLDANKHLATAIERMNKLFPEVEVSNVTEPIEGWRPASAESDADTLITAQSKGGAKIVRYPAMSHSGVRWSPSLIDNVLPIVRSHERKRKLTAS